MTVNLTSLKAKNEARWNTMHVDSSRLPTFDVYARRLIAPAAKARYIGVQERLRQDGYKAVPWWFIAIVSVREYGGPPKWDKQLAQGSDLDQVSTIVPKGRGPFLSHPGDFTPQPGDVKPGNDAWTRGCLDALIDCNPKSALWPDWSPGGTLTQFEMYNGLGYAAMGKPSAYVWSGSDQYKSGKYVRDHVYDPDEVDVQVGCAPLLARMMLLDPSIKFGLPDAPASAPPPAAPKPEPAHGFWDDLVELLTRKVF
jgi:lysozyme family protein